MGSPSWPGPLAPILAEGQTSLRVRNALQAEPEGAPKHLRTPVTQVSGPRIWAQWRSHFRKALTRPASTPRGTQSPPLGTAASSSPSSLCPPGASLPPTAPGYLLCGPVGLCHPGHQAGGAPGLTGVPRPSHQSASSQPPPPPRGCLPRLSSRSPQTSEPQLRGAPLPRAPGAEVPKVAMQPASLLLL